MLWSPTARKKRDFGVHPAAIRKSLAILPGNDGNHLRQRRVEMPPSGGRLDINLSFRVHNERIWWPRSALADPHGRLA